jgi:hypothetical protein
MRPHTARMPSLMTLLLSIIHAKPATALEKSTLLLDICDFTKTFILLLYIQITKVILRELKEF